MEKQRAEKHSLTAHSACVDFDGNGVLILGKEGSGKTTTAINLCQKYGASLVANDLSIISYADKNNTMVLEGTKYFFLRKESIKRNLPKLLEKFGENKIDSWLNKVKVMPEDISIRTKSQTNIKRVFIVHIDNSQETMYVSDGATLVNKLYLNENFHRYIRNACTTFLDADYNMSGYVPSFDSEQFYIERVELINHIFKDLKFEYVSGNIKDVSKYINEEMSKIKQITTGSKKNTHSVSQNHETERGF